jgi:hypothetical protein
MLYKNVIVAKHSPDNLCFAQEGEILVPAGPKDKMRGKLPQDAHFFIGVETGLPSRYGWVKELDYAITANELAHLRTRDEVTQKTINYCEILLTSVAKYATDTAMACHFLDINLPGEKHRRELRVHKVIFYKT